MSTPSKSLGQHWLHDRQTLVEIASYAEIAEGDTVLEIGPGLGTLTSVLLSQADKVIAVEFDSKLAKKLPGQFPGKNLKVINEDILKFNFNELPAGYKVVANVPYYITGKIVEKLLLAENKPELAVLLVQKEVAERLAAKPGEMSVLSVSAQIYAEVALGNIVGAEFFTPPPKVDSQVAIMKLRKESLLKDKDENQFFKIVKAGFGERRKKLKSSLSGGLHLSKNETENLLAAASIDSNLRAQDLKIEDWLNLYNQYIKLGA